MGLSTLLITLASVLLVLFAPNVSGQFILACTNNITSTITGATSSFANGQASAAQRAAYVALLNGIEASIAFSPLNAFGPFGPSNPLNILNPLNPFNPVGLTNPFSPNGITNPFNPFSINSPLNVFNPSNPLNPFNPFNPFTPTGQINNLGLLAAALQAVRPVVTPAGVNGELLADLPYSAKFLIKDLATLNFPGVIARFVITGPLLNPVVVCSIPTACGNQTVTKVNGTLVVTVQILNSFPYSPIVVPLTLTLTGTIDQTNTDADGNTLPPTGKLKVVQDFEINGISVPNTIVSTQSYVRFCTEAQSLLDGDCFNRCHNNKRKCPKDPACRWFARGQACIKKST
jgi:hypothetical protein